MRKIEDLFQELTDEDYEGCSVQNYQKMISLFSIGNYFYQKIQNTDRERTDKTFTSEKILE